MCRCPISLLAATAGVLLLGSCGDRPPSVVGKSAVPPVPERKAGIDRPTQAAEALHAVPLPPDDTKPRPEEPGTLTETAFRLMKAAAEPHPLAGLDPARPQDWPAMVQRINAAAAVITPETRERLALAEAALVLDAFDDRAALINFHGEMLLLKSPEMTLLTRTVYALKDPQTPPATRTAMLETAQRNPELASILNTNAPKVRADPPEQRLSAALALSHRFAELQSLPAEPLPLPVFPRR